MYLILLYRISFKHECIRIKQLSPPKLKSDQHLLQKKIKNQMRLDKVFDSILLVQAMADNVFDTMNRYEQ